MSIPGYIVTGLLYGVVGAAVKPWFTRWYEKNYSDDETAGLLAVVGGATGLLLLFLLGSGVWYLLFER